MDMTVVYSVRRYYNCMTSDRAYMYTHWEITGILPFFTHFARCLLLGVPITFNQVRDVVIILWHNTLQIQTCKPIFLPFAE